eukprot:3459414-Pyramimonas_sp.AAC.1
MFPTPPPHNPTNRNTYAMLEGKWANAPRLAYRPSLPIHMTWTLKKDDDITKERKYLIDSLYRQSTEQYIDGGSGTIPPLLRTLNRNHRLGLPGTSTSSTRPRLCPTSSCTWRTRQTRLSSRVRRREAL